MPRYRYIGDGLLRVGTKPVCKGEEFEAPAMDRSDCERVEEPKKAKKKADKVEE